MKTRGQITLFVGIAVFIIIAIGAAIYFTQKEVAPEHIQRLLIDVPEMAQPIAAYMYACMDGAAPMGIQSLARGGGHIFPSTPLNTDYGPISYGFLNGASTLVSIEDMQSQLAGYLAAAMLDCFDVSLFEKQGFKIETGDIIASSQILLDKVIFTITYPMKISKGEATVQLEDFVLEAKYPLGRLHQIADLIVTDLVEDPSGIDLAFTEGLPEEVEMLPVDRYNFAIAVRDKKAIINDQPVTFLFASSIVRNAPPSFTNLPDNLEFTENQDITFQVKAEDPEGDNIIFSADPTLFEINQQTGEFVFTPEIPGEYEIMFTVTDAKGNAFNKLVEVFINPEE